MTSTPRATLADVAAEAGVSVSTASRALRGRGEMAPETRMRVRDVAAALGYARAAEPRGRPRSGTSRVFDLVLGHFHDPYTDEVTAGARTAAARLGYDLVLTAERDDPADDWPVRVRSRGSAGVILGLILPTAGQVATLRAAGIPIVLLEPPGEGAESLPRVRTTDRAGGGAAAEHLVARGARRFLVIGGSPSYRYGRARVEGFVAALGRAAPGAVCVRTRADWSAWDARRACATGLAELGGDGPIGVFACSDEMAAGAYRAIADAGLSVPRDVLVVGFDDVRGARWLHPPLTTVRQPIREMAAAAVQTLAETVAGRPTGHRVVEFATELVARGSTAVVAPSVSEL
ncbi:LacI family transcriptional regulator [Microbacterium sp. zg.Y1090]|uniref:LacI family DNA-binding transcriptional regulator n=1 Tax=Microbacterium wangruii TaxID=3049073 RepID=UPI00214B7B0E|nr:MULTISPECIES: LacI family DNA-binding transcriptional regulator [unclassified Microbacterium]MCR2817798.1 LacI family transcriptional regulator [Microbacterium sp. zg.Y1090]WIM28729.1 LacI family DNA-binding transcriptional regulator [Microbacterium sp. zg-Y1090]